MKQAEKIAEVLSKACPAFFRDWCRGITWQQCYCSAKRGEPCICVWRKTDTCIAGKWPQLAFINDEQKQKRQEADIILEKAKQAIADANKP